MYKSIFVHNYRKLVSNIKNSKIGQTFNSVILKEVTELEAKLQEAINEKKVRKQRCDNDNTAVYRFIGRVPHLINKYFLRLKLRTKSFKNSVAAWCESFALFLLITQKDIDWCVDSDYLLKRYLEYILFRLDQESIDKALGILKEQNCFENDNTFLTTYRTVLKDRRKVAKKAFKKWYRTSEVFRTINRHVYNCLVEQDFTNHLVYKPVNDLLKEEEDIY